MGDVGAGAPASGVVAGAPKERESADQARFPRPAPHALRADIQALRAVAVTLVVAFHSWPNLVPGGYVGVDVFFVISGYLITKHLLDETERTGTLGVLDFWMRRARRLLPASLLVLAATAAMTWLWAPQGLWRQYFRELSAATLYVQNWALADASVDYFASGSAPSPVQHFWSLSVEEQFYAGLPLLVLVVLALHRLLPSIRRRALLNAAVGAVWLGSFGYSLSLTSDSPSVAYFSTLTRAWEFSTGALLASFAMRGGPRARALAAVGWSGLLLSALVLDGDARMPGALALAPVLGAAAVIAAGTGVESCARWLRLRPVAWLGNHSYSLYLWHWPLLIFAPFAWRAELGDVGRLGVNALALGLASLSTRWVEDPIRYGRWPRRPPSRAAIALASAAGMACLVAFAAHGVSTVEQVERASAQLVARLRAEDPPCLGARARLAPCDNPALAQVLVPSPAAVTRDFVDRWDCREGRGDSLQVCSLGPSGGYDKRLALVGDSHAAALLPAFELVADQLRWRIDVATKNACHWTSNTQLGLRAQHIESCVRWKARLNQKLMQSEPYDAIVVTHRAGKFLPGAAPGEDQETTIVRGLVESWRTQAERGTRIIAVRDNPRAEASTAACVARHLLSANEHCSLARDRALGSFDAHVPATRALPGSQLIDLSDLYCDAATCPAVMGGVIVYRDDNHFTATFARTLAPALMKELKLALD